MSSVLPLKEGLYCSTPVYGGRSADYPGNRESEPELYSLATSQYPLPEV